MTAPQGDSGTGSSNMDSRPIFDFTREPCMTHRHSRTGMFLRSILLTLLCSGTLTLATVPAPAAEQPILQQARKIFRPLPKEMAIPGVPITAPQVKLGR